MSRGAVLAVSMSQTVLAKGLLPSGVREATIHAVQYAVVGRLGVSDLVVDAMVPQGRREGLPLRVVEAEA